MNDLEQAIVHKLVWKGPKLDAYAAALLLAARRLLLEERRIYFNNDDVPEPAQPGDKTTVGAVVKLLAIEGLIEPWRGNIEAAGIWGGMRRSSRRENHGHRNQLYTLTNLTLVDAWLARHGAPVEPKQMEMALA